jgi:hypothetical protein
MQMIFQYKQIFNVNKFSMQIVFSMLAIFQFKQFFNLNNFPI